MKKEKIKWLECGNVIHPMMHHSIHCNHREFGGKYNKRKKKKKKNSAETVSFPVQSGFWQIKIFGFNWPLPD